MEISTHTVTSVDGTTIGYQRIGSGPALVIVPGNNRMAHNYDRLATALADEYTVCIIERRGRGNSGPQGANYSIEREVEDLSAVATAVHATAVFGHSYGGLVALAAAASTSLFGRVSAYEPAISIGHSFDLEFRAEFAALLDRGKHVRAMTLFFHATRLIPLPYPLIYLLSVLFVGRPGEMRSLMPTTAPELEVVAQADGDGSQYASIRAETLLIGGTKAPSYLLDVLDPLCRIIPNSSRLTVPGADHNAPDESMPADFAEVLRPFLVLLDRAGEQRSHKAPLEDQENNE
ncbi:MAG TPA: alpha/beta hydrolase [Galbitalea sp.]|jgi:pimeloyl-ACP methyl ester carboxylesterase|nr:alpha/beta hydrolase [Galbitalea sp.]